MIFLPTEKERDPALFLVRILSYYIAGRSGVKNERIAMGRDGSSQQYLSSETAESK